MKIKLRRKKNVNLIINIINILKTPKKMKTKNTQNDVIKAFKKANREIELERNGGRWIAINRPHKNKKKYDRKRDKKINIDLSLYFFN